MSAFVQDQDYRVLITTEQFAQITENQTDKDICLEQSLEEIKEYLRHRFDVEFEMRDIADASDAGDVTALENARIWDVTNSLHYLCIKDATNQPLNATEFFTQTDDRNQKLVQVAVDVFLYHLHTRLNPRNIPEHRKIRYDGDGDIKNAMSAVKWLLMVQKGTVAPDLTPLLDEDGEQLDTGQSIIYGNSLAPRSYADRGGQFTGNP